MKIRNCNASALNTGVSECQPDFEHVIMALVLPKGHKLPENLNGTKLEQLCHADRPDRVMPIARFVEYAKNGGEANVSATGYGPNQMTDYSARTDAYTMQKYSEMLAAEVSESSNTEFAVYYVDKKGLLYGTNDGSDTLAGFAMSTIYPTATPHPTSGNKAELVINFCHADARESLEKFDYEQLDFNPANFAKGLVPVKFVEAGSNKWKLVEARGGYDRTAEFGALITATPSAVLNGTPTSATYDAATQTITVVGVDGTPTLKEPSALYEAGVKFIVQA